MPKFIKMVHLGIPIAAMAMSPAMAQSPPSFDCSLAHSPVEQLICSSPNLGDEDRLLASQYNLARERHPADTDIKKSQIAWWKRREACASQGVNMMSCVKRAYGERMNELGITKSPAVATAPTDTRIHGYIVNYTKARGLSEEGFAAELNSTPAEVEGFVSRMVSNGSTAESALASFVNVAAAMRDPSKNWVFGCLGINIYENQQSAGPRLSQEECDRRVGLGDRTK